MAGRSRGPAEIANAAERRRASGSKRPKISTSSDADYFYLAANPSNHASSFHQFRIDRYMRFLINEAVSILERTPAVMDALLRDQSSAWLDSRIEPTAFSPRDVLGHLIFGEMTDWIPRARLILQYQQSRTFEPFDRRGFVPLIKGKSIDELLRQFADLRSNNIEALKSFALDDKKLDLPGLHPELGEVTMRQLLATWVVHDLNHIAQIMRIMANEYREEVGPWRAYLSILNRG